MSWLPSPVWRAFLVTRAAVFATSYLGLTLSNQLKVPWRAFPDALVLDGLLRWDCGWYWEIVAYGYQFRPGRQSSVAFFPLYPHLSWLLGEPLRWLGMEPQRAFFLAGLIIANLGFLVALVGLFHLTRHLCGAVAASRTVWLIAIYPFSLFFSAAYTESLALALAVWACYLAVRDRWVAACALAALCGATRLIGVFLLPALALELVRQRGWRPRAWFPSALALPIVPLGLVSYCAYLWWRFGEPLAFMKVQSAAGWSRNMGLEQIWGSLEARIHTILTHPSLYVRTFDVTTLAATAAALGLAAWAWRRLGAGLALFGVAAVVVPMLSGFVSMGRYIVLGFPAFMMAGVLLERRPRAFVAVCVVSGALLVWFMNGYAHGEVPY